MDARVERILRNVIRDPAYSIIVTDEKGITLYVNQSFTDVTGYTNDDMIGKKPGEVLQGIDTESDVKQKLSKDLAALKPTHVKITNYDKEGQKLYFILDIRPSFETMADGSLSHIGFVGIQTDVRESTHDDFYRDRITSTFLTEIAEMKNLIGLMQHDVRDALSGVIAMDSLGMSDHQYTMNAINNCMKIIKRCTMKTDSTNVKSIVDDIIKDVNYRAVSKGITLVNRVPGHIYMFINAGYLFIILRNFIINAIKYGYPHTKVTVSEAMWDVESYITVTDQGDPFSQDIIDKLMTQKSGEIKGTHSIQNGSRSSFIMCRNLLELYGYHIKIISNQQGTHILVGK